MQKSVTIFRQLQFKCTFSFLSRGIILWIELPQTENLANTCTWHMETLDSCFDLIITSAAYIVISPTGEWTSDYRMQCWNYHWAITPHCTQVMPYQLQLEFSWSLCFLFWSSHSSINQSQPPINAAIFWPSTCCGSSHIVHTFY